MYIIIMKQLVRLLIQSKSFNALLCLLTLFGINHFSRTFLRICISMRMRCDIKNFQLQCVPSPRVYYIDISWKIDLTSNDWLEVKRLNFYHLYIVPSKYIFSVNFHFVRMTVKYLTLIYLIKCVCITKM